MERRQHPRHSVRLLVQHQARSDETFQVDYATDLSRGGLFLNTPTKLAADSTLHVQFAPAKDARLISAFCKVTRVTSTGVGAQFISLDAEATKLIEASIGA